MNSQMQRIKDKLKNIAQEKNTDFNSVMRLYMYERFIERLSISKYKDNFILKGGFYLSTLFGIDKRATMDIDAAIRYTKFREENLIKMISEIINIDVGDNVKFKIEKIVPIRDEDEYGGLRITINFILENIRDKFHIDLATGDPIYPDAINYKYEALIENKIYNVWAYNLETLLSEKIETILSKLETSSRMKDYYDIYLIHKFSISKINKDLLKGAVKRTFKKRNFKANIINNFKIIEESMILRENWLRYIRKNKYTKDLNFEEIIKCLKDFIELIDTQK